MKVDINVPAVASALIIVSVVSVLIIAGLTRIDRIVHVTLYDFGLIFSYQWAMPYWIMSGIIIGTSWFNLAASLALAYSFIKKARSNIGLESIEQRRLAEYLEEPVETPSDQLVSVQVSDPSTVLPSQPARYDVRRPKDVVDSQC